MVYHKISNVQDSVCHGYHTNKECGQLWQGECRAFSMPHSEEEKEFRLRDQSLNCEKINLNKE